MGLKVTPLRRMTAGIAFSGVAWVVVGAMQLAMDGGAQVTMALTFETEGGEKPVCVAETLARFYEG